MKALSQRRRVDVFVVEERVKGVKISEFITINGPREGISEISIKYLSPDSPRTPTFYLLPKIYKPDNPGRSIVANYDFPTECISAFIDSFDILLVTIDVTSFYTNIPYVLGLAALEFFLNLTFQPQLSF